MASLPAAHVGREEEGGPGIQSPQARTRRAAGLQGATSAPPEQGSPSTKIRSYWQGG